jgi:hypothetical protein
MFRTFLSVTMWAALVALSISGERPALNAVAAKCTGKDPCPVCTNCQRCGYCKNGKTCGACKPKKTLLAAATCER